MACSQENRISKLVAWEIFPRYIPCFLYINITYFLRTLAGVIKCSVCFKQPHHFVNHIPTANLYLFQVSKISPCEEAHDTNVSERVSFVEGCERADLFCAMVMSIINVVRKLFRVWSTQISDMIGGGWHLGSRKLQGRCKIVLRMKSLLQSQFLNYGALNAFMYCAKLSFQARTDLWVTHSAVQIASGIQFWVMLLLAARKIYSSLARFSKIGLIPRS